MCPACTRRSPSARAPDAPSTMASPPMYALGFIIRLVLRCVSVAAHSAHLVVHSTPIMTGRYGDYGGRYVSETLMPALEELADAFTTIVPSEAFQHEWRSLLSTYVGRPTP